MGSVLLRGTVFLLLSEKTAKDLPEQESNDTTQSIHNQVIHIGYSVAKQLANFNQKGKEKAYKSSFPYFTVILPKEWQQKTKGHKHNDIQQMANGDAIRKGIQINFSHKQFIRKKISIDFSYKLFIRKVIPNRSDLGDMEHQHTIDPKDNCPDHALFSFAIFSVCNLADNIRKHKAYHQI